MELEGLKRKTEAELLEMQALTGEWKGYGGLPRAMANEELLRRADAKIADVPRRLLEARECGIAWAIGYCSTLELRGVSVASQGGEGARRITRIGMGVTT